VPHVELGQARCFLAQESVVRVASERPGIVLGGAYIDLIELVRSEAAKEWILELRISVVRAEKKMKGVLGIVGTPRISSPDANARSSP
jgi:hypothetical protein